MFIKYVCIISDSVNPLEEKSDTNKYFTHYVFFALSQPKLMQNAKTGGVFQNSRNLLHEIGSEMVEKIAFKHGTCYFGILHFE